MIATVLCFGNLQLDVLCRTVTALPPPGELHMIDAIDFALSGNGGNVAAALGRLGLEVELAGCSGAEIIGEQLRVTLAAMGVGTVKLLRHPTASTGISVITLSPSGERSVIFVNGANALLDLDAVPDTWLHGRRVVSVGSIFALPQFTGEAVGRLFVRAKAHGATTVLNICWDADGRGLPFLKSALSVEAIDCTGAGDSFVAGFIAGLVEGRSVYDCAHLGCQVAAFAVTGPGSYPRIPTLAEVDQLSRRLAL